MAHDVNSTAVNLLNDDLLDPLPLPVRSVIPRPSDTGPLDLGSMDLVALSARQLRGFQKTKEIDPLNEAVQKKFDEAVSKKTETETRSTCPLCLGEPFRACDFLVYQPR